MRLLKVGRDASCDIVLHSDKVSSLHAEITLLNNGDILLEDKGSRNGTFLMNKPINPGTAVTVRRGDMIRFADVELQWGQIPMPEDNSSFKALYGIGSNFRNEIQISGNTVSRFHATLKIGKDGSMLKRGDEYHYIEAWPADTIDATGAGDTYAAGFLYAHSLGMPLKVCGEVGSIIAAKVVEVIGTKIDIPRWKAAKQEIRGLIAANAK